MKIPNLLSDKMIDIQSSYLAFREGRLVSPLDDQKNAPPLSQFVHNQIRSLVLDTRFACLGARSAVSQGAYRFGFYPEMGSLEASIRLSEGLRLFVREQPMLGNDFTTFIASFMGPTSVDDERFEHLLWSQLQALHDADTDPWDSTVSSDPQDPHFSFSFAGRGFFIIGLHSGSTRWTRRFAWPTLVFNAHYQFEQLREKGQFERFQQLIRTRDKALQGNINPNLATFGAITEARQYSGRQIEGTWNCPLHVHQR